MKCTHCGMECESGVNFCTNCGAPIIEEQNVYSAPEPATYEAPNPTQVIYENPTPNTNNASVPGQGFAIAGMVCGIVSFFFFTYVTGALGIIFGFVAKSKGNKGGMATAGIVCGSVSIAIHIIFSILLGGLIASIL